MAFGAKVDVPNSNTTIVKHMYLCGTWVRFGF